MKNVFMELIEQQFPQLLDNDKVSIHHAEDEAEAASYAVKAVSSGQCACSYEREFANVQLS